MTLQHTTGNILTLAEQGHFDIILHDCNCFNTFGAGLAKEIKIKYPQAYQTDCQTIKGHRSKLGNYSVYHGKFIILNCYAQYLTASYGEDVFEYDAFNSILKKVADNYGNLRIGLPYIGMGLAGGDSSRIIKMIEDFADRVVANGGSVHLVAFK